MGRPFCKTLKEIVVLYPEEDLNSDSEIGKQFDEMIQICFMELIIALDTERLSAVNLLRFHK